MGLENFLTYTEVDVPANHLVVAANHLDFICCRNEDVYLYKDRGPNHFRDFEHLLTVKAANLDLSEVGFPWVLANTIDDVFGLRTANQTYLAVSFYCAAGLIPRLYIEEGYDPTTGYTVAQAFTPITVGATYYLVIKKIGLSFTCEGYATAAARALRVCPVFELCLTLRANHFFRYNYAANTLNTATALCGDLDIDDLDLQEVNERFQEEGTDFRETKFGASYRP